MTTADIQYVSDEEGKPTAVLVPIDLWREIAAGFSFTFCGQIPGLEARAAGPW